MTLELTDFEVETVTDMIEERLEFCNEPLRDDDEYGSTAAAMVVYDGWPEVALLRKLDPLRAAKHRTTVEDDIREYHDE